MIRPNEIRTTMTAAAIVIIAATTVMISTIAIRIAIGIEIGTKTAIASIRTETVIVTMMRITTAIIASTAADLMAEIANGAVACRRRIRADLTAITRAGSDIAEVTIKARPRAWTDACGTFTRITGFQKTPIKPGKTRKFALTSAFWGLRYALDTIIHSNAVLSLCFGEFSPKSALWAAATNRGSRASFCGKGLKLWPTRGK